ncbi:hypothetical protein BGZ49_007059 [Haplosporangium sp. Z 27]|nr:hypothetical protein BGZ49_007059 [Haplosporangium sp. Z 27]
MVVQGVYKLEPNLPKFYGRSGEINETVLEQYHIPSNDQRNRPADTDFLLALASSPTNPFAPRQGDPFPVLMALFTAKTNENRSTHDYDYTFWKVGDDQSNGTRHTSSLGMLNTIRSVPTITLVDGHEAMYRDSFEATKVISSLTTSVLASEQAVKDALEEIEMIKEQIENAKVAASSRKRERLLRQEVEGREQKNLKQKQQQQHQQQYNQSSFTSPNPSSQVTFNPAIGSPPDLLY